MTVQVTKPAAPEVVVAAAPKATVAVTKPEVVVVAAPKELPTLPPVSPVTVSRELPARDRHIV